MATSNLVKGVMEVLLGLAMLPIAGGFVAYVQADENLSGILGFSLLMSLVVIILAFVVIWAGVKMIKD
jgi:hypothetical protein